MLIFLLQIFYHGTTKGNPLRGTIGNITFYKSGEGYLAREKGGIDAKRIATDPAFQRTPP